MQITDNVNILMCFNDKGTDKAYEVLKNILNDLEYIDTTPEKYDLKIKELIEQNAIKQHQRLIEKEEKKRVLKNRYISEFKMIDRAICSISDNLDLLKAIDLLNDTSYWKIIKAFEWGFIQGKRADRARRKRGIK